MLVSYMMLSNLLTTVMSNAGLKGHGEKWRARSRAVGAGFVQTKNAGQHIWAL